MPNERPATPHGPVWGSNPKGRGHFFSELRYISLIYRKYTSLDVPWFEKRWPPARLYHLCKQACIC